MGVNSRFPRIRLLMEAKAKKRKNCGIFAEIAKIWRIWVAFSGNLWYYNKWRNLFVNKDGWAVSNKIGGISNGSSREPIGPK